MSPRVRERVRFGVGNLVQGEGFDFTGEFDLVLCRNLLMYLLPSAQVIAVRRLVGALSEHGLLILGHAESGIAIKAGLVQYGKAEWFAFRPSTSDRPPARAPQPAGHSARPMPKAVVPLALPDKVEREPPQPATVGSERIASLDEIRANADRGATADALIQCRQYLAVRPESVEAHLLLAALSAATGDVAAAEVSLRRALYLDNNCLEALTQLAALRSDRGDFAGGELLRARAERLARSMGDDEIGRAHV